MERIGDITMEELRDCGPMLLWTAIPSSQVLSNGDYNTYLLTQARWTGYRYIYIRNISGFWSKREPDSLDLIDRWNPSRNKLFGLFRTEKAVKAFGLKQRLLGKDVIYHSAFMEI